MWLNISHICISAKASVAITNTVSLNTKFCISQSNRVNMSNRVNNIVTRHIRGNKRGCHCPIAEAGTNTGANTMAIGGGGGAVHSGDPVTAGKDTSAGARLDAGAGRPL